MTYPEKARARIKATKILERLQNYVLSRDENTMSSQQVAAARILLAKVLPDLQQTEHTGSIAHKHSQELTRDELLSIAATGRAGDSAKGRSSDEPESVH